MNTFSFILFAFIHPSSWKTCKIKQDKHQLEPVSVKEMGTFVEDLESLVKKEELEIQLLVPAVYKQYTTLSGKQCLHFAHCSLWESAALTIFQMEKLGKVNEDLNGNITLFCISATDGSVIKNAGRQVFAAFNNVVFNEQYFENGAERLLRVPLPTYFGHFPETKANAKLVFKTLGREIAILESYPLKLRENLIVHFRDSGISADGGMGNKFFSHKTKHRCLECPTCFEDVEKMLSQRHLNNLPSKSFENIERDEMNEQKKKESITKHEHGTKEWASEKQQDIFYENLEAYAEKAERDPSFRPLSGCSFATYGVSLLSTYKDVPKFLKQTITQLGGRFQNDKSKADFIICSHFSARKILGIHEPNSRKKAPNLDHKLKLKKLVNIRFVAALAFGHCTREDVRFYQFTVNTPLQDTTLCPCSTDSTFTGIQEYPIYIQSYWETLLEIHKKPVAERMFKEFITTSRLHFDCLHNSKGKYMTQLDVLDEDKKLDMEGFKAGNGSKKKKAPSQMSGKRARQVLCDYENTIIPHLKNVNETEKQNIRELMRVSCGLQFFAYAPLSILSERLWRLQCWLYSFLDRELLKKVYSGDSLKKVLNMHVHSMHAHLAEYVEECVKKNRTPIQNSTEYSESRFAVLNKMNSNKHEESLTLNWIANGRRHVFQGTNRNRNGSPFDCKFKKWQETHKWEAVKLPRDPETAALLEKLQKFGYHEGQHWRLTETEVVFEPPPPF